MPGPAPAAPRRQERAEPPAFPGVDANTRARDQELVGTVPQVTKLHRQHPVGSASEGLSGKYHGHTAGATHCQASAPAGAAPLYRRTVLRTGPVSDPAHHFVKNKRRCGQCKPGHSPRSGQCSQSGFVFLQNCLPSCTNRAWYSPYSLVSGGRLSMNSSCMPA